MESQPWVLAAACLLIVGVLLSKTTARFGVPSLLLFLGVGMLAGSDGVGGIEFDNFEIARSFGIVALGFILFSGGLDTQLKSIKPVLARGVALASIGVIVTATVVGLLAALVLDLRAKEGLLLGAVIASTDAAAVFTILRSRGIAIDRRLASTLELESGSNDPAAVFLTVAAIELVTRDSTTVAAVLSSFALQMTLGAVCGYVLARIAVLAINRLHLEFDGMYPVLTFAFVLVTLEGVTYIGGSGFLALYVAGVTMNNRDFLHKRSLARFHDAIAWLVQIAMFVLLGLLVFPSDLPAVALEALLIAAVLMFVARPIAVALTLLPFRTPRREVGFISWVGLRGASPIILATFPVAANVPNAERLFNVVFFIVLTSVLVQGTTIGAAAKRLRLSNGSEPPAQRTVSFDTVISGDDGPRLHEITVGSTSAAAGRQLVDLAMPAGALVVLVRRDDQSFMPEGSTVIHPGDALLVAAEPQNETTVAELFGQ